MSAAIPTITTSRLILRPLDLADVAAVQALFPKWEIVRFMSNQVPWPYPADGALTFICDLSLPAMRQGTEWHWSIRRAAAPEQLIGVISLRDKPDDNRGFWLDPEWHGQGLMSEAVVAVTDYWFETLARPLLRAPKAVANEPSRRISERSGMRVVSTEDRDYVSGRLATEVWEITRDEWRKRRG
jgi:ribosomal-protein-alanine N-acetyltransferase